MFVFLTRSYDEGFKVFTDSGAKADDKTAQDFEDALQYSGVKDSAKASAVMFRRKRKIYVIARSMDTGKKDKNTRNILFTFCVILDGRDGDTARKMFSHLAERWGDCEAFLRECLGESFAHEKFQNFLKDYPMNAALPANNYVMKCERGFAPEAFYVRPSGIKRHLRFAAVYMAVIAVVVYVTMGLHSGANVQKISDEAKIYADIAGAKIEAASRELNSLSGDIHIRIEAIQSRLDELIEAEKSLAGLYAEARSADSELELSYLRIRSMENADETEAEYLAKSSGEAADKAERFSDRMREKVRTLRENLGL